MITVTSMSHVKGQHINDFVQVLEDPFYDEKIGKWCALANVWGMLAIIELRITPQVSDNAKS